ncbi:Methyltransferase-like protein 25 [Modicella reniformis]|uniref:Methyltransferase-like protein 25 n=1 Tax=Modicella reniformis TaxID=1440133 RepID=A0A9P6MHJ0_9FUNG|nr:Methyltransferase-like protein 25 [Modicella reniformis]
MDRCTTTTTTTEAFLPQGFDTLEDYILCLQAFLTKCEPITNLMIVDYFTTNSWEIRLPKEWRDAFESEQGKLGSLDLMQLVSLGKLRDFNQVRSSRTTTLQEPQDWPDSLKDFVAMVKKLSINRTLDPEFTKFKDTLDIHLIPGMSPKKLHEVEILSGLIASYAKEHSIRSVIDLGAGQGYLSRVLAFQHHLCVLGVDSNTIQTCGAQTTQKRTEKLFVNKSKQKRSGAEGRKKSNRINRTLTPSCSSASTSSVAPIETETSTTTTTTTAAAATTVISPPSPSIPPLTIEDADVLETSALGTEIETTPAIVMADTKLCKKAKTNSRSRSTSPIQPLRGSISNPGKKISRGRKTRVGKKEETQGAQRSSGAHTNGSITTTATAREASSVCPTTFMLASVPTTLDAFNTSSTTLTLDTSTLDDVSISLQENRPAIVDSATDPTLAATPGSNFQLQHITHHITASTLPTLLREHFPKRPKRTSQSCDINTTVDKMTKVESEEEEEEEGRWTLCGLHACGDLTSNMIKLYLESSATCLFSVGCCYHWITERFDKDGNITISDGTHGFPLSAVFNLHKAHLGEHAKMTACQSPERWLKYQKETEDAIHGHYFRALLHKLMVERGLYPGPPSTAPVLGRMGKHRLKGFPHYLATAISRLKLPTNVIKHEEAQATYEQFLEKDLYRIGILWALRTMLGPLFEGMILLDRAAYLHETIVGDGTRPQKGSVQLVPGFDVVESPRNMILIALKD